MYYVSVYREKFISSYYGSVASLHYAPNMFTWCPHAKPVANRPNTRNGCAAAWYFTSFLIGSGKKNLNCAKICGAIKQNTLKKTKMDPDLAALIVSLGLAVFTISLALPLSSW